MQHPNSMVPPHYQQQPPPQQPQWPPQYQVPPPHPQNPAAAYYYQQPPQQPPMQQHQQYAASQTQQVAEDGIRSLWIGDLQYWMDEQYLFNCFAPGEVVGAKVIRNKQTSQSEGYGFIEFASHAAAEQNLQTYNGAVMPSVEQPFRLNWASMGTGEKRDDGPDFTIFVGDLAGDVTDSMLQETFRAIYTSVKGAKVVTDKISGRSKGYGFVRFSDESEHIRAMTEMNGRFCSTRQMRIGPAANKQKAVGQTDVSYPTSQGAPSEDDPNNTTVFVGNLDSNVTDEYLRQVFGQYGQLLHVKIPMGKRCGFVQFADRSCAEEAIRMLSGTQMGGQSIRLSWGRSPSNKQGESSQSYGSGAGGVSGYHGYTAPGYEQYGYAPPPQDPSMYYAGYPGYGSYAQPPPQQQ